MIRNFSNEGSALLCSAHEWAKGKSKWNALVSLPSSIESPTHPPIHPSSFSAWDELCFWQCSLIIFYFKAMYWSMCKMGILCMFWLPSFWKLSVKLLLLDEAFFWLGVCVKKGTCTSFFPFGIKWDYSM
jgi:hypothetical protein